MRPVRAIVHRLAQFQRRNLMIGHTLLFGGYKETVILIRRDFIAEMQRLYSCTEPWKGCSKAFDSHKRIDPKIVITASWSSQCSAGTSIDCSKILFETTRSYIGIAQFWCVTLVTSKTCIRFSYILVKRLGLMRGSDKSFRRTKEQSIWRIITSFGIIPKRSIVGEKKRNRPP